MTDRIFISHASEDAAVADKIVAYLEARGVPCWISSRDIPPRAIYADAIVEGMQSCGACAVLVSAASNASKAVKREVELASHEDKAFIPIRIDGSEPTSGLAYYLRNIQWIDYCGRGEAALEKLAPASAKPAVKAKAAQPKTSVGKFGERAVAYGVEGDWRDSHGLTFSFLVEGDTIHVKRPDGSRDSHKIFTIQGPMESQEGEFWAIYATDTQILAGPRRTRMTYSPKGSSISLNRRS